MKWTGLTTGLVVLGWTAFGAVTMGCDGEIGPGEYTVYRVSTSQTKLKDNCFEGDFINEESVKEDKSSFRNGATMILYLTDEETAVLDASGFVLNGSGDGEAYSFSGESTDVEFPPADIIFDSDHDGIDDFEDPSVDADMDGLDDDIDDMVDVDSDSLDDRFEDDLVDANNDGEDDRIVETFADLRNITTISADVDFTLDGEVIAGDTKTTTSIECKGSACPPNYKTYKCTRTQTFDGVEIEDADVSVEAPGDFNQ